MATKKKGINLLTVGLGVALGAAGAMFLSKKENRAKVSKAVKKIQQDKGSSIMTMVGQLADDLSRMTDQKELDVPTRSTSKRKRK